MSTSLTASNQLNSIVPHTPVGSGTDIGAIDGNSLWTPGVQGWTPQQNINLEDIFYDPGIVSSNLLLHLDFANSTFLRILLRYFLSLSEAKAPH